MLPRIDRLEQHHIGNTAAKRRLAELLSAHGEVVALFHVGHALVPYRDGLFLLVVADQGHGVAFLGGDGRVSAVEGLPDHVHQRILIDIIHRDAQGIISERFHGGGHLTRAGPAPAIIEEGK